VRTGGLNGALSRERRGKRGGNACGGGERPAGVKAVGLGRGARPLSPYRDGTTVPEHRERPALLGTGA